MHKYKNNLLLRFSKSNQNLRFLVSLQHQQLNWTWTQSATTAPSHRKFQSKDFVFCHTDLRSNYSKGTKFSLQL